MTTKNQRYFRQQSAKAETVYVTAYCLAVNNGGPVEVEGPDLYLAANRTGHEDGSAAGARLKDLYARGRTAL